ncbi:hypothetical protein HJG60_011195 [Phyllostomus discolor]|uniref:Uncharacterized protein n=1 Tax=Phyllostomus discolor TaxID=89673 RepID=A0A834A427_9CHIR|nr:hypothetical protein HJG60_011195 [Phyllostomus discolor]
MQEAQSCVWLFFLLLYFLGALAGKSSQLSCPSPLAPAQPFSFWCHFPLLRLGPGLSPVLLAGLGGDSRLLQVTLYPSVAFPFLSTFPLGLSVSTTLLPTLSLCISQPVHLPAKPQSQRLRSLGFSACLTLFLSGSPKLLASVSQSPQLVADLFQACLPDVSV